MAEQTADFWDSYVEYKSSGKMKMALAWIERARQNSDEKFSYFRWMDQPGIRGFFVAPFAEITLKELEYIQEYWKEVLLLENYVLQRHLSEEEKEQFYFKPKPSWEEKDGLHVLQQKFGNISIDFLRKDSVPGLKLLCTYYSGFSYSEPYPLEFLLDKLLS